ncbi:unnamed protein product [Clonostachys rosea]|uniref:Uncharacterized protein n=1 Tax=Bionectria ochroleuca TaxID=29856 RepID=A0ABY6UC62_BIOOC|nr:unnamed protein product [Clonostachys rosea]
MDANWEMYDPGPFRKIPILPSFKTPERLPPVAFTGAGSDRLRIGSTEFFAKEDGTLRKGDGAVARCGPHYWEDIQVREPYRVASRRRLVTARCRFRKAQTYHSYNWQASSSEGFDSADTSSTEEETSGEEETSEGGELSEQSFGITSPAESWSSASNSSLQDSDSDSDSRSEVSASRAAETSSESSEQETQLDSPDGDTDSTRSSDSESTDTSDGSMHSDNGSRRIISNIEEDSDESISFCDSSSSEQQQRVGSSKLHFVLKGQFF